LVASPRTQGEAHILFELVVIVALALLSGALAGAKIAVVALGRERLLQLVQSGSSAARAVKKLRDRPERFFATVHVSVTLLGAAAGVVGGSALAPDLASAIGLVPWLAGSASGIALCAAVLVVSYLSIVLGQLIPKSLAIRYAEPYALSIGKLFRWLSWVARPVAWLLTASANAVLRLFGERATFTDHHLSPDEIQELVTQSAKSGAVDPGIGEIASRAIDFAELCAAHVMVPRSRVIGIPRRADHDELRRLILEEGHTRMPVFEGTIDKVIGYVTVRDLITLFWEEHLIVLEDVLRPAYFVPKTTRAVDLLSEMKRRRIQLAIVVDETQTMVGIVTLEDLVEELVGDIFSEHDDVPPEMIRREADGAAVVLGEATVREVNRQLDLCLPEGETWSTMAGLCLELAGRIPQTGEQLDTPDGSTIEIVDATPRTIRAVRVRPPPRDSGETA
jgi:putative hemolysin